MERPAVPPRAKSLILHKGSAPPLGTILFNELGLKHLAKGQTPDDQLMELREVAERAGWAGIEEYVDQGISGAKGRDTRVAFDALCQAVTQRKVDVVMAWSVDRLGRSLKDLIGFSGDVRAVGRDVYLHKQGIDLLRPEGRCCFRSWAPSRSTSVS